MLKMTHIYYAQKGYSCLKIVLEKSKVKLHNET